MHAVAALHQGAPGQVKWLCISLCFASVIVWTKQTRCSAIAERPRCRLH